MDEGVHLDLEAVQSVEEEEHTQLKAKEEACLIEEERLKYEE